MADIVERLWYASQTAEYADNELYAEAAREIERLREFRGIKAVGDMLCPPVPKSIDPTGW